MSKRTIFFCRNPLREVKIIILLLIFVDDIDSFIILVAILFARLRSLFFKLEKELYKVKLEEVVAILFARLRSLFYKPNRAS